MRTISPVFTPIAVKSSAKKKQNCAYILIRSSYRGRCFYNTHIEVKVSDWDNLKNKVKASDKDFVLKNKRIQDILNKLLQKTQELEQKGLYYTSKDIVEALSKKEIGECGFKELTEIYIKERCLSYNTARQYISLYNILKIFIGKDNFGITDIDKAFMFSFCNYLKKKNHKNSTSAHYISQLKSIWKYCIEKNETLISFNPFINYSFTKQFKRHFNKVSLSKNSMEMLFEWWLKRCVVVYLDGSFAYNTEVSDKLIKGYGVEYSVAVFLFSFVAQGIAFADVSRLKVSDFKSVVYDDKSYYIINTKRVKTNKEVIITIEKNPQNMALIEIFLYNKGDDDYVFPVLNKDRKSNESEKSRRVNSKLKSVNKNLKKVGYILENNYNIHIECPVSFYVARHTFATSYMNCEGASLIKLSKMMGRNVQGIDVYLNEVNSIEDIIQEKQKMG